MARTLQQFQIGNMFFQVEEVSYNPNFDHKDVLGYLRVYEPSPSVFRPHFGLHDSDGTYFVHLSPTSFVMGGGELSEGSLHWSALIDTHYIGGVASGAGLTLKTGAFGSLTSYFYTHPEVTGAGAYEAYIKIIDASFILSAQDDHTNVDAGSCVLFWDDAGNLLKVKDSAGNLYTIGP